MTIPPYDKEGKCSPLGFPMCQSRMSVPLWSYVMELYPPKQIVEIGSLNGGFTTAIGVHAWRIGCKVFSFDVCKAPNEDWKELSNFLGIEFWQKDVFQYQIFVGHRIMLPGVTFLLCDGGNKAKEFNTFAMHLKSGDIIAAHDYCAGGDKCWPWSEIKKSDVAKTVKEQNLEPFMQEYFDEVGWLVYKKR